MTRAENSGYPMAVVQQANDSEEADEDVDGKVNRQVWKEEVEGHPATRGLFWS